MPDIRKLVYLREESFAEAGRVAPRPIIRAVALILIGNPFAGRYVEDLSPLVELGPALSTRVAPELMKLLGGPAVSYGKGAIVGAAGELEHGAICTHGPAGMPELMAGQARSTSVSRRREQSISAEAQQMLVTPVTEHLIRFVYEGAKASDPEAGKEDPRIILDGVLLS